MTVSSVCLSVLSMLSSAPKKIKPPNDAEFVKRAAGRGPKAFLWSYDDDKAWFFIQFFQVCYSIICTFYENKDDFFIFEAFYPWLIAITWVFIFYLARRKTWISLFLT